MEMQSLFTDRQLGPMILVTVVLWGLGDAKANAAGSILTYGEPQLAETHPSLVSQVRTNRGSKTG